jgi:hypothetical protein
MAPRGGAWRANAPVSSAPGSISGVAGVSGSRPAAAAKAALATAAAGAMSPADTGKMPPAKIGPPSSQMRAAQPVARVGGPPGSSVGPAPSAVPSQRTAPAIRPVAKKDGAAPGPGVRPPPPSQRSIPPSERKMPAAAEVSDDAKTMIATTSAQQIKELMAGKRPSPAGGALPPPPPSPVRKANPNLPPPKPMPPSRSNQLAAPPVPPSSERNMPAARATGANPGTKPGPRPGAATMKGIAPAPPGTSVVPSVVSPKDEAENVETGRIKVGEDDDEQTDENTERRDIVSIGDDVLADAEAALEAMRHFQNAETAAVKGDWRTAEILAKKAVQGDDSEPRYQVLLAWVQSQAGTQPIDDAIRAISKVLIEDPANEKGLFYRGKLLTKKNKLREALNDFDELLAANPNHPEAQSEVKALRAKLPQ